MSPERLEANPDDSLARADPSTGPASNSRPPGAPASDRGSRLPRILGSGRPRRDVPRAAGARAGAPAGTGGQSRPGRVRRGVSRPGRGGRNDLLRARDVPGRAIPAAPIAGMVIVGSPVPCQHDATPDSRPQPSIGGYELIEEIARGGMGVVYRARHQGLKRLVALKMIMSGSMATFEERERFLREAELAANLDHANIVPIYEVGEHEDRPFFSMKLVEGTSLTKQAGRFRDDPRATAWLAFTLAHAVDYAHGRGFLHCDLKPSNVLLDGQGKPYLTDFGLARRTGVDSSLSISGAILGTPSYMAPEQATGSRAGSDRPPTFMAWAPSSTSS